MADKKTIVAFIREQLARVDEAKGKPIKAAHATELFEFLTAFSQELVAHKKWLKETVAKALEFRREHPDFPHLVRACDRFLARWGPEAEAAAEVAAAEYVAWTRLSCAT